jgi:hypothetical protein
MIGSRFECLFSEGLSERPDRSGNTMAVGDHVVERALDPVAIVVGDN